MNKKDFAADTDVRNYFPMKDGKLPPSSVRLTKLSSLPEDRQGIFQIDSFHSAFMEVKDDAHKENIEKYYQKSHRCPSKSIIDFLLKKLLKEHPEQFSWEGGCKFISKINKEKLIFDKNLNLIKVESFGKRNIKYTDSIDALMMQVQEDLVVCTYDKETDRDFVSAAHLMTQFGWDAVWALNKPFSEIHEGVKRADKTHVIKNPSAMVKGILKMPGAVERIGAVSFRSNVVFNSHPDNDIKNKWTWDESQRVFARFERQTVTPLPEDNSFIFTIKPHWADLTRADRIEASITAAESYDPNVYHRKFLDSNGSKLISFLKSKLANTQSS